VYKHLVQALSADSRNTRALDPMTSSALDNYVGVLWVSKCSCLVVVHPYVSYHYTIFSVNTILLCNIQH